ncbi:MAG: hypothetical protein E7483_03540 [Ruminococcaceae bacterium]|nr:hypothetical protein [Oscillospiraceae bacterium]
MKKLFILTMFLFVLSACSPQSNQPSAVPQPTETVQAPKTEIDGLVESLTLEDVINKEKIKELARADISVSLTESKKITEETALLTFEFTKGEHSLVVETPADLSYFGSGKSVYNFHAVAITVHNWGTVMVLTYPDKEVYYSTDNLTYIRTVEFTGFEGRIIDTIPHGAGCIALYLSGDEYGLAKFTASGEFLWKSVIDKDKVGGIINATAVHGINIEPRPHIAYLDKSIYDTSKTQQQLAVVFREGLSAMNQYNSFIFNPADSSWYHPYTQIYNSFAEGDFYVVAPVEKYSNNIRTDIPATAFVLKDGIPKHNISFDSRYLMNGAFCSPDMQFGDIFSNMNTVTCYCPSAEQTMTVDFANRKVTTTLSENMMKHNLQYKYSISYDGNYSLWTGNYEGGGDVLYEEVYLLEEATGKVKYIDTIGGMYGGSEEAGFFSNGDIYSIGLDKFNVYSKDMNVTEPLFVMSRNFKIGSDLGAEVDYRHLLAARRDPVTHSYVVLYNEGKYNADGRPDYIDEEGYSNNFYKSTYKVGVLDPQGNLTKVYETGEHVMTYAFRTVQMYMLEGDVLRFDVLFKGRDPQLECQLDMKTGKYTCLSGGYNSWINAE